MVKEYVDAQMREYADAASFAHLHIYRRCGLRHSITRQTTSPLSSAASANSAGFNAADMDDSTPLNATL
jgi:hypothetical protein